MHQFLENRPSSGFPVSIGTGLSLETLFSPIQNVYDENRVISIDKDFSINNYSLFVFNISTLLRNIITSIKFGDLLQVSKDDILTCLLEEIDFLTNFFESNNLNIKFYINNYEYVKNVYGKENKLRTSTTDKQIYIDGINEHCLNKLKKEDEVTLFSKDIKYGKEHSVLLFTHIPFDLLSYNNFLKLELLESHTGIVKTRKSFNTKYYSLPKEMDMSFLPFMEYLLSIFGDHVMFHPAPLKERIDLYKVLKTKNVNALTSEFSMSFLMNN